MAKNRAVEQQQIQERRREVARLRLAGVRNQRELADRIGVSLGTINGDIRAINKQIDADTISDTTEAKRTDLARTEALIVALWPSAMNGKAHVVDRIVSLMQHKAKLLGLNAPEKREDTHRIEVMTMVEGIAESAGLNPEEIIAEAERYIKATQ